MSAAVTPPAKVALATPRPVDRSLAGHVAFDQWTREPVASVLLAALCEEVRNSCWWASDEQKDRVRRSLIEPWTMPMWIYQALLARRGNDAVMEALGHAPIGGNEERSRLLDMLIAMAPWQQDPTMGIMPRTVPVPADPLAQASRPAHRS